MLIKEDKPTVAMKETKVNPPAQHCEIVESRNSFHELDELLPVLIVGKDFATTDVNVRPHVISTTTIINVNHTIC